MLNEACALPTYKYNDRIGIYFRDAAFDIREILLDDAAEDFARKLLALIVTDDADLNLLLMAEDTRDSSSRP